MNKLRVWKITVAEKESLAKDYWMVPAVTIEAAITSARKDTAKDWEIESAVLVEGDWIIPANQQRQAIRTKR
jgi:hypothetical protein